MPRNYQRQTETRYRLEDLPKAIKHCQTETRYRLEDLKKAIQDVNNKTLSLGKAATAYSVPKSTIHDHLKKEVIKELKTGRKAIFSDEQEMELEEHIIKCSKLFYDLTIEMVRKIAFKLAEINKLTHNFDKTTQRWQK
ncbi:CENP-B N-terminal DNA-binding domain [Popillia japonica]|uniref:CENP-B N-terminal DNA-binding domain n=1 Tax=Popillia japonica TaxID=7064 RepID=A0AAW1KC42_POPJA